MVTPLLFVIAAAGDRLDGPCTRAELQALQRRGPRGGFALRLFTAKRQIADDLRALPLNGSLLGEDRRGDQGQQLICDALIPNYEPQRSWLAVYAPMAEPLNRDEPLYHCLDRFALNTAGNETCWFYPTHDGTFLSWEQRLELVLEPGSIVDPPDDLLAMPYERARISVLWSLLADDSSLSCVGITYGGQRIAWPLREVVPERMATWSRFCVDSEAEDSLRVEDSQTVFA